ncbi:MAG: GNAT family N-acetyltransferase [Candidatus Eisenbacteria bacterium]|nr:GNAT family N-acetyltransferase [Candidatus Eisenbacteria bacterium]MCC7143211.1 GNAT family N-acetyltransferase [Candidatus Eisenbacteria bacterium]
MMADLASLAEIAAEREGTKVAPWRESFERLLRGEDRAVLATIFVAESASTLLGYGKCTLLSRWPDDHPAPRAPVAYGWYLSGLVVRPDHRRQGVGRLLTEARLRDLALRDEMAYYFANATNQVSIALHEKLGFVELTRHFAYPGAWFEGGVGVLCACDLAPWELSPTDASERSPVEEPRLEAEPRSEP